MIWALAGLLLFALIFIFLVLKQNQMRFEFSHLIKDMKSQLDTVNSQISERIKEMNTSVLATHQTVGDRLDSATRVFGSVKESLGKLEETNRQICEISKDISSLESLLKAPKFRGLMGETMLENLISQVLPAEHYRLQFSFKTGETVDAAVYIGSHILSIDAKFPLENFKKFMEAQTDQERNSARRVFIRDIKNRISEVSNKYILPDEKTFDFALMYIPAESVYYEITKDDEIIAFAKEKKIIPVSPNTFYAYLQAICYGLKGLNIERNILKVMSELGRIAGDFEKFKREFLTLGAHLKNARQKFEEVQGSVDRIGEKLADASSIKSIEEKPLGS